MFEQFARAPNNVFHLYRTEILWPFWYSVFPFLHFSPHTHPVYRILNFVYHSGHSLAQKINWEYFLYKHFGFWIARFVHLELLKKHDCKELGDSVAAGREGIFVQLSFKMQSTPWSVWLISSYQQVVSICYSHFLVLCYKYVPVPTNSTEADTKARLKFVPNLSTWRGAGSCELHLQLGAAQGADCGSQRKHRLSVTSVFGSLCFNATKSVADFMVWPNAGAEYYFWLRVLD